MTQSPVLFDNWVIESDKIHAVEEAGGISEFAVTLPSYNRIWEDAGSVVTCIDERVKEGVRAAGSLILLPLEEARAFCARAGITGLTSHAGCGAAGILYRRVRNLAWDADVPPEAVEQFAQSQTRHLAAELGLEYRGHIPFEGMRGPRMCHIARAIYYTGLSGFNPHAEEGLPTGFIIERVFHTKDNAIAEVELAISIILGEHGYGSLVDEEDPIYIYVVADKKDAVSLTEELELVLSSHAPRVRVEPFIPR